MDVDRIEAARQNKSRYDGKPCRSCGGTERFVSNGNCVVCAAEHTKKYREKLKNLLEQARAEA